jgi:hypothetical protein
LEKQSEANRVSPTLSKLEVKQIGVLRKFAKTKWSEVKPFKIVPDRSKTNIFLSYCEEEEKRKKNEASFFLKQSEEKRI